MGANSKALITGISGFIAGNLAQALQAEGIAVVGVGRSPSSFVGNGTRFVPLDMRDFDGCVAVLQAEKPQTVYHLAANSVLSAMLTEGPHTMLATNAFGTLNLLEACRIAEVPTVVVASSDKQYGAMAKPPYEDADTSGFQNGGVYELSKAQQDQIARLYAGLYDVPAVRVARLVNIYGPGDTQWTRIVPGTVRRLVRGERPRITAGPAGKALREYLYVEDCVRALRLLAADAHRRGNLPLRSQDGKLAQVAFNLPSGQRFPAGEVIQTIQRLLRDEFGIEGPEPEVQPGPEGVFEPGHQFVSGDRLQALFIEWLPLSLEEGLRRTIPWYLNHLDPAEPPP
ncbi:MAG: GDP-mannose 4,6-dehydratase [Armatimonadaceae bacterium]